MPTSPCVHLLHCVLDELPERWRAFPLWCLLPLFCLHHACVRGLTHNSLPQLCRLSWASWAPFSDSSVSPRRGACGARARASGGGGMASLAMALSAPSEADSCKQFCQEPGGPNNKEESTRGRWRFLGKRGSASCRLIEKCSTVASQSGTCAGLSAGPCLRLLQTGSERQGL